MMATQVNTMKYANASMLMPMATRNFGASEKQLKIRMKSVNSIKKITKAMKMVAASKMKGNLTRLDEGRYFGNQAVDMIFNCDTYMQKRAPDAPANPRTLLVPITSDKGLCGGTNSGIIRNVREFVNTHDRSRLSVFSVGDKGQAGLKRGMPDLLKVAISDTSKPINYPTVMAVSEMVQQHAEGTDKIVVFYNEFVSAIKSEIRQLELMPRQRFLDTIKFGKLYEQEIPDKNTSNLALYELYVTSNLWIAFLNNAASEESARI